MEVLKRSRPADVVFPDFGLYALESHHARSFSMAPMRHDFAKLLFVIDGKGTLEIESAQIVLDDERLVFVPPSLTHRIVDDPRRPLSLYVVCIVRRSLPPPIGRLMDAFPLTELVGVRHRRQWQEHFQRLLFEQTMQRPDRSIVIMESVLWMLGQLSRNQAVIEEPQIDSSLGRVRYAVKGLQQNFFQQQSLAEAAERAGMSERRFSQLFREVTGDSWLSYLRRLRVEHACRLLVETERSVTAISFECGFSDLSNFYRAFKTHTQKTPLSFRMGK